MDGRTRQFVRRRAGERCEYCRLPQAAHEERFSVDHIIAVQHRPDDAPGNLAFACLRCNLYKGPNLSGIDPVSNQVTLLFTPREQSWHDHFEWAGSVIVGRTPTGRATVTLLQMNAPERVQLRQALIREGLLTAD
jgi:hypothetical protein